MKQLGENPDEQEVVKMIQLVNKNGESDDDHDFQSYKLFRSSIRYTSFSPYNGRRIGDRQLG